MKKYIADSELILNEDGSVFHLHLKPEQLAEKVILVGDPGRVGMIEKYLSNIECKGSNREFCFVTVHYDTKRITVLSTGIGTDNIDIVMNELDALVNIDLNKRCEKDIHRSLTLVRIGTCGGLQPENPTDSFLVSEKSIGFDGLLNFYANRDEVSDLAFEQAFTEYVNWNPKHTRPYVVDANAELVKQIAGDDMKLGVTISAPGFYGPQGRVLRLPLYDADINEKITGFEYKGRKITNFEMESSALAGLSLLLGHRAATVCQIIANRSLKQYSQDYKKTMEVLVQKVLQRI
ncbi:MAG: nucleoside phosphorylase [Paludibacteraceae bacterium]|nr:nucleoside phosphorylase [Paludibacteraceae bacterium]